MRRVAAVGMAGLALVAACTGPQEAAAPPRATTAGSALEPRPDWSMELPALLPGIKTCLAESGQPAVGVTKAWAIGDKLAGVRILKPGGERLDCVAELDGSDILLTERVWTVSQLPGEHEPLFTPGPTKAPSSNNCTTVSVARDAVGRDIGWLSYDVCRQPRPTGPSAQVDVPRRQAPHDGSS
jgi:hypothetical protein